MAETDGVVVVGAGLGGLRVVEGLRRAGWSAPITLVGAERHAPYDRPPLTKQVLRGERDHTHLPVELAELGVTTHFGVAAVSLDGQRRVITLSDGRELDYAAAVLAPGARPRSWPGVEPGAAIHVVRTIEDALRLRERLGPGRTVTVIGAGFIGCEVAASARALGTAVHLVEALGAPLERALGVGPGRRVAALHREHGVHLHLGVGVAGLVGPADAVSAVRLADGTELPCDDVVLGLGVRPDVDWLAGSGLELHDGIRCDDSGRTALPGVYALGDAAEWWHEGLGGHRRLEHWTSVGEQAAVVVAAIAGVGSTPPPAAVPYFWSDQYDLKLQALGFVDGRADIEEFDVGGRAVYVYSHEGVFDGVVGFSAARTVMPLRGLLAAGDTPIAAVRERLR